MPAPQSSRRVRFDPFVVDFTSFELFKHGIRLKLQDQPFQILRLLVQRHGDLVTREELRMELWTESTFVDFDAGLNAAIRRLRDALSDSAEAPRYIETLPRHGYRFIADVEELPEKVPSVGREKPEAPKITETLPKPLDQPKEISAQTVWSIWTRSNWFPAFGVLVLIVLLLMLKAEGWKNLFVSHASTEIHSLLFYPCRICLVIPSRILCRWGD